MAETQLPQPRIAAHASLRVSPRSLAVALAIGLIASCGRVHDLQAAETDPAAEAEAELIIPEGMEDWAHLLGHNESGATMTNGLNKRLSGMVTLYHKNGVKQGEGQRDIDGKQTGPWTHWFDNGMKRWEGTYDADRVVGLERAWYDDGTPHYEGAFENGKRSGSWSYWHPNGRPMWQGNFQKGKRHGTYIEWEPGGTIDEEVSGTYELGEKVADYTPPAEPPPAEADEALANSDR